MKASFVNSVNVSRTKTEVLKTIEEIIGWRDPKDKNEMSRLRRLFTKAEHIV